jgi:hypothetical protein
LAMSSTISMCFMPLEAFYQLLRYFSVLPFIHHL